MNIELKPCPFCGGEAEMMGDQYPYVECQGCAAGFTANHSYEFDEDDAASKWNARSNAGPKLKPIAESKVRQLGGDVCGVLVRKDEKLAAVDEHGRVQWLHGDSEHTAYLEGMNAHLRAELKAARAQGGRGADAVKWSDPAVDPIVSKLYRKFKEWNRQGFGADDVTWCEVRGYVAELLNTQPQPAVP
jgi:Lar family restriction alleviation protein